MMIQVTIQIQATIHTSMIDEVALARRKENVVCRIYVFDEECDGRVGGVDEIG